MRQCFKEFMTKVGNSLQGLPIRWTSTFRRSGTSAIHVIFAEGFIKDDSLDFGYHKFYPSPYKFKDMDSDVELIDKVTLMRTLKGPILVVKTLAGWGL